jgi:hypothetical protein
MAKKKADTGSNDSLQNTSNAGSASFVKGLVRDFDENFDPESSWPYARNAVNNSVEGDLGLLGNEMANYPCAQATYTIMGRVHLFKQYWIIFSTDVPTSATSSEIGLYDEDLCTYRVIVNDACLNLSTFNLITGASKENFDCSWSVYFSDGRNPDRVLNVGNPDLWPTSAYLGNNYYTDNILWPGVSWVQTCKSEDGCTICTDTNVLDCDKIKINKIVNTPCIRVDNSVTGGNLYNGSYFAVIGYTIDGQRYGDYTSPSNVQYIFNRNAIGGSLDITITNLETSAFTEFELVVVSIIDQATVAKKIGIYNTSQAITINLDNINDSLVTVPLEFITIRTPKYETSQSMFEVSNYLLRIGPRTTFDFNYQPLANQITTNWVIAQYPSNYYKAGGYITGYMRDEVYSFFIRWIYDTGEKSKSYHIPGRAALPGETDNAAPIDSIYGPIDLERFFEVNNTATIDFGLPIGDTVEDGGVVVRRGIMAYWESTEKYPDQMPDVWADLCNKPIRHHKMPEDIIGGDTSYTRATGSSGRTLATHINILGVEFQNIQAPTYVDENGNTTFIPGIVGYEILRGSREGNKSVVAKGIINNMREYTTASGDEGLYPNYPYNPVKNIHSGFGANGYLDPSLSNTPVNGNGSNYGIVTTNDVKKNYFTFHSPDTNFYKPYLSVKELRLYTELGSANNVAGNFEEAPGQPRQKILTDLSLITSTIVGMAEAALSMRGKQTRNSESPRILNLGLGTDTLPLPGVFAPSISGYPSLTTAGIIGTTNTAINLLDGLSEVVGADFAATILGIGVPANTFYAQYGLSEAGMRGYIGRAQGVISEEGLLAGLPTGLSVAAGVVTFFNLTSTATNNNLELIYSLVRFRQYVLRYISHGVLHRDNLGNSSGPNKRRFISDSGYLTNQFNVFDNRRINNLFRSGSVILKTQGLIQHPNITDNTVCTVGTNHTTESGYSGDEVTFEKPFTPFTSTASCYYVGTKLRYRNQYGQLDSIKQIPINCSIIVDDNTPINSTTSVFKTPVLFGGDIYISRYTEKNTFFYFSDWLYNEPDGTDFDYSLRYLGLYPRYWANFEKYDTQGFLGSVLGNLFQSSEWNTPANTNNLDGELESTGNGLNFQDLFDLSTYRFNRKFAYMYLFQSGVRDFYVETDLNIAQRDWGDLDEQKYYEVLTNLSELFDTNIIKSGNYFKLDPSLSISNLFNSVISWGNIQDRSYNPIIASLCYQYLPNRVIYSLPESNENRKDNWQVFLPNNYKDFRSEVLSVKDIGKNGAMIFFKYDSPVMFQGSETLETDLGTKITIGDGALFSQPLQSLVNSDESYEYGSCQDKFSIISTPMGVYWISQNQGKVLGVVGNLTEVSSDGMRWWFGKFLPFRLLNDFPDFQLIDNPVAGIGCQSIYDNDFQLLYFSKKDYELKKNLPEGVSITYSGKGTDFLLNGRTVIKLGDPLYFNNVSWTLSYDPKSKIWVSFHDWHPDLTMPSKLNFISTKGNTMWRHNDTSASYCNYYGVDYPFQVEYVLDTGQEVVTLRNIEYLLECYVYDIDGIDRFHLLDYNFDDLVVYNTEQVSGKLNLSLSPKNDPFNRLNYPRVNADNIDIIYDKVEQKIRVNQFWDITDDRGEFNPNVQRPIWLTEWDGYKKELNPANLNYNKSTFERKKFRHYYNNVLFTKKVSGNVKMLMKIANNKNLNSPR